MQIIHTPHSVLTTPAKEVKEVNQDILQLIDNMKVTLDHADNPKGVGLAAPQVGQNLRIFLLKPEEQGPITTCINPRYLAKSKTIVDGIGKGRLEGCLSVPRVWGMVRRHQAITLCYLDETAKEKQKKFDSFSSIIVQHEMDHLDGILFTRRVFEQKGVLYRPITNSQGKEVLEPIEI